MSKLKQIKGMTLLEIIVALALLGIVMIALLNMFTFSYTNIFSAGFRSDKILEVQMLIDDLTTQHGIQKFATAAEISTYLTSEGYNSVSSLNALLTKQGTNDINYYVNPTLLTKANVQGYEVTLLKFFNNGSDYAQLTVFIIKGGA